MTGDHQTLSLYRQRRRAAVAAHRALQRWPGVHGQVLAEEIRYGYELLPWLGPTARCARLIDYVLDQPEGAARQTQ